MAFWEKRDFLMMKIFCIPSYFCTQISLLECTQSWFVVTHAEPIFAPRLATGLNLYENCERFRDLSLNLAMMVTIVNPFALVSWYQFSQLWMISRSWKNGASQYLYAKFHMPPKLSAWTGLEESWNWIKVLIIDSTCFQFYLRVISTKFKLGKAKTCWISLDIVVKCIL